MAARALVLGGGGVTGVAWELGMLAGLADAGVNLAEADVVVGTSAGSVVGAQLTSGVALEELYEAQLAGPGAEAPARLGWPTMLKLGWAVVRSRDPQRAGARMGRMALTARTVPEAQRRSIIEARLPRQAWPDQRLLITAVDAESGEFTVFDRDSGVSLVDAVGASCAVPGVWPPVSIDGHRYIDGGMRSVANIDLAVDCERVVVLAPLTQGFGPMVGVDKQVAELRRRSRVAVVSPDADARRAIGRNMLDPAHRPGSARAGRAQASAVAREVEAVWSGDPVSG